MKTTRKEYLANYQERSEYKSFEDTARRNEDWGMVKLMQDSVQLLEEKYFNLIDTVCISFFIGSRSYYEEAVKIGKTYFQYGRSMTQGNGYYCINEIDSITDEMNKSMMADSYYY